MFNEIKGDLIVELLWIILLQAFVIKRAVPRILIFKHCPSIVFFYSLQRKLLTILQPVSVLYFELYLFLRWDFQNLRLVGSQIIQSLRDKAIIYQKYKKPFNSFTRCLKGDVSVIKVPCFTLTVKKQLQKH